MSKTVLIVEDDPLTAEAHADFVRRVPGFAVAGIALGGVEALARWDHPDLGLLLPDEFVGVLEATGQIGELTSFVLDESLAAARR